MHVGFTPVNRRKCDRVGGCRSFSAYLIQRLTMRGCGGLGADKKHGWFQSPITDKAHLIGIQEASAGSVAQRQVHNLN